MKLGIKRRKKFEEITSIDIRKLNNTLINNGWKKNHKRNYTLEWEENEKSLQWRKWNRTVEKNQQAGSCFFFKIDKITKFLTRMTMKKRKITQITKIRKEKGDITTSLREKERITRELCEQLDGVKFDNLDETEKFLAKH